MVRKAWKLATALLLLSLVAAAAVVPRAARARVIRAVEDRCRRTLDGRCTVGSVQLGLDGISLREVTFEAGAARYHLRAHHVGLKLHWLPLLFRSAQNVDVDVDGVDLQARATLEEMLRDLRNSREGGGAPPQKNRLRLRGLHIAGVRGDLGITDADGRVLSARLDQGGTEWSRDSAATTVRWRDASIDYVGARAHTGACTILDGVDATTSLDCREFEGEIDSARLRELRGGVEQMLVTLRPDSSDGSEATPDNAATPPAATRQTQVRFQDGRVKVLHHTDVIADLAPATMSVILEGRTVTEASLQLGEEGSRQPSLSLAFNRMHEPWQVDLDAGALPLRQLAPWVPAIPWHGTDAGRAHARVHLEPVDGPDRLDVSGDLFLENFGLEHPGLAREPIDGLSVSLDGRALIDLTRRRVSSQGLNWHINGIPFVLAGWVERTRERASMDVSLHVPSVRCDGAMNSLPRPVTGIASGLGITGTIGGDAHLALDTARLPETVFGFDVRDGCAVTNVGWGLSVRRFADPFVQRVQEPGGRVRAFVTGPGAPAWVPIEHIPPNLLNAVISREDGAFYRHRGFSPGEIRGALIRNVNEGRFAYGASTITMQLVKNVFLAREKTLVRKLQEVVLTWWTEQSLDKQSILELYLNVVEFGPGIYGVGPASRFFFGREPRDLTVLQAIYLATLLPAPVPRFAIFERGTASPETVGRLRAVARAMAAARMMTAADAEAAQHEVFAFRPRNSPVPGSVTLDVDPATTDEAARAIAEQHAVQVRETPASEQQGDASGSEGAGATSAEEGAQPSN